MIIQVITFKTAIEEAIFNMSIICVGNAANEVSPTHNCSKFGPAILYRTIILIHEQANVAAHIDFVTRCRATFNGAGIVGCQHTAFRNRKCLSTPPEVAEIYIQILHLAVISNRPEQPPALCHIARRNRILHRNLVAIAIECAGVRLACTIADRRPCPPSLILKIQGIHQLRANPRFPPHSPYRETIPAPWLT